MYRPVATIFIAQWPLYASPSGQYMYRPVVTICTASLTFNNSTFSPNSVFMCFVWIWEQTAIISLYSINWLVCITETQCVYCAVRTASLTAVRLILALKCSVRYILRRWPVPCRSPQLAPTDTTDRTCWFQHDLATYAGFSSCDLHNNL
jgi:hypothetical protein